MFLAGYTYNEHGALKRSPMGEWREDEEFHEALRREGFNPYRFEIGQRDGAFGLQIYARQKSGIDDYLVVVHWEVWGGPVIYVPSFAGLWELMVRFHELAVLPTRG